MSQDETNKIVKESLSEMYDKGKNDTIDIIIVLLECEKKMNGKVDDDLIDTVKSFKTDHHNNKQN